MKKAFTMIELIFVIVILGILAAVALPKFLGVAQQAHEGNLKSFVGTLNRSVGPNIWSKAIASSNADGKVTSLTGADQNLSTYVDIPKEFNQTDVNLSQYCGQGTYQVILTAPASKAGTNYTVACQDGNVSHSMTFRLYKNDSTAQGNTPSTSATCIAGPGCE